MFSFPSIQPKSIYIPQESRYTEEENQGTIKRCPQDSPARPSGQVPPRPPPPRLPPNSSYTRNSALGNDSKDHESSSDAEEYTGAFKLFRRWLEDLHDRGGESKPFPITTSLQSNGKYGSCSSSSNMARSS